MFAWHSWIKGLIAALIGGVSTGVLAVFTSPDIFQEMTDPWQTMGKVALSAAVLNFFIYLKTTPLPNTVVELQKVQHDTEVKIAQVEMKERGSRA